MATVESVHWNEDFVLGDAALDDEHRRLLAIMNSLVACANEGVGFDLVKEMYADLVKYTFLHFKREEALFEEIGYPGAAEHARAHRQFTDRLVELPTLSPMTDRASQIQFARSLCELIRQHFSVEDQRYIAYVRANGGGRRG